MHEARDPNFIIVNILKKKKVDIILLNYFKKLLIINYFKSKYANLNTQTVNTS